MVSSKSQPTRGRILQTIVYESGQPHTLKIFNALARSIMYTAEFKLWEHRSSCKQHSICLTCMKNSCPHPILKITPFTSIPKNFWVWLIYFRNIWVTSSSKTYVCRDRIHRLDIWLIQSGHSCQWNPGHQVLDECLISMWIERETHCMFGRNRSCFKYCWPQRTERKSRNVKISTVFPKGK